MNNKICVGDIFYKYIKELDKVDTLRVIKFKNSETVTVSNGDKKFPVQTKLLMKEYTRIKPDGYITFSIISIYEDYKDVIITLHRKKDIDENGMSKPYCACRQNITNVFANQIIQGDYTFVGMSMNIDSAPIDVPYEMILSCDKVIESQIVSIYIDDTLDQILSYINTRKYDEVLCNIKSITKQNDKLIGYCETLKELLVDTEFMQDFYSAYNIIKVPFKVVLIDENEIIPTQRKYLEDELKCEMFKTYLIKYSREIDLGKIKREYILVSDDDNDLYVLGYDKGKYINRTYRDNIKDKRDASIMLKYASLNKK